MSHLRFYGSLNGFIQNDRLRFPERGGLGQEGAIVGGAVPTYGRALPAQPAQPARPAMPSSYAIPRDTEPVQYAVRRAPASQGYVLTSGPDSSQSPIPPQPTPPPPPPPMPSPQPQPQGGGGGAPPPPPASPEPTPVSQRFPPRERYGEPSPVGREGYAPPAVGKGIIAYVPAYYQRYAVGSGDFYDFYKQPSAVATETPQSRSGVSATDLLPWVALALLALLALREDRR